MKKLFLLLTVLCCFTISTWAETYNVWVYGEQLTDQSDYVRRPGEFAVGYYPEQDSLVLRRHTMGLYYFKTTTGSTKITVTDNFVINNTDGYGIEFTGTLTIGGSGRLTVQGSSGAFNSNNIVLNDGLTTSASDYTVKNTDVVIGKMYNIWINGTQLDGLSDYVKNPATLSVGYYPEQDSLVLRNNLNLKSIHTSYSNTKITLIGVNQITTSETIGVNYFKKLQLYGTGDLIVEAGERCFYAKATRGISPEIVLNDKLGVQEGSLDGASVRIGEVYPVWINGDQLMSTSEYVKDPLKHYVGYYPEQDSLVLREANRDMKSIKSTTGKTKLTIKGENVVTNSAGYGLEFTGSLPIDGDGSLLVQGSTNALSSTDVTYSDNIHLYGDLASASVLFDGRAKVGVGPGEFTVGEGKTVKFTMGNLLYFEAVDGYCLAGKQYESQRNTKTTAWRSYMKWDSEGYKNATIGNTGINNLRTLSVVEWKYLFQQRAYALYLYGNATVDGHTGFVILPDNWTTPSGLAFVASATKGDDARFTDNVYTAEQWEQMETAGAVFLPADGLTVNNMISFANSGGYYGVEGTTDCGTIFMSQVKLTFDGKVNDADQYTYRLVSDTRVYGDVNGDEVVDIADVNAVLTVMFGGTEHEAEADVNGDNAVDIADVNAVLTVMFSTN